MPPSGMGDTPRTGVGGSSASFSPAPPGVDYQGRDLSPELQTWQGVEAIPEYIRLIQAAEKKFNLPEISTFAGSDYRSHDEQAALYADHLAGRHPAPVAPPGQSYHEQGEAIDWDTRLWELHPEVRRFLINRGVVFDVPGEPWHGHLTRAPHVGGILNPGQPRRRRPSPGSTASIPRVDRSQQRPTPPNLRRRRRGGSSYTPDPRQR